mgnify:CR=1 FL=1
MAKETLKITIDDGTREIPVVNTFGQPVCTIHFRPADYSIFDRYKDFAKDFEDIVKPLENVGITNNGEAAVDDGWQIIKQVEGEIIQRFNDLLDTDDAAEIFAKRNAFSSVGGKFFCEVVLDALGDIIVEAVDEERKKSDERMKKYLS